MLDLRTLRGDAEAALVRLGRRGDPEIPALVQTALRHDEERRRLIAEVEALKAERNIASKEIGERRGHGEDASEQIAAMQGLAKRIRELDGRLGEVEESLREALLQIPNLPDERVPPGVEGEGETLKVWGDRRPAGGLAHWDIGAAHGTRRAEGGPRYGSGAPPLIDLERGSKISGSGFPLLVDKGARLSRGIIQFMIDLHTREHGYVEIAPPLLVSRSSMMATGHVPKFEEDAYRTEPDDLFLVPTAEVPLTNLHRDEILAGDDLPLAYVAHTPCFRREAGAAGKDTRGLLRVHQFDKVELVRLCRPEDSVEELETLTRHAERVLELLEVPYRRVLLPAGDLGFANAITYDLEIWSAGVGEWLEVSSCSCYTDYQARRASIRFRPLLGASPEFVHTLNGSALALARLLVALLENGHTPGEGVVLPEALHPYLGFDLIEPLS